MTPRKGNLMGVRTDIKVLDATIRDGGLCNNFDFSDEFVRELYKTNIKSGVDYMEFGTFCQRARASSTWCAWPATFIRSRQPLR